MLLGYRPLKCGKVRMVVSPGLKPLFLDPSLIHSNYRSDDINDPICRDMGNGVIKITDSGNIWRTINTGLDASVINTLVVDPKNPGTLYAGTQNGVYVIEQGK